MMKLFKVIIGASVGGFIGHCIDTYIRVSKEIAFEQNQFFGGAPVEYMDEPESYSEPEDNDGKVILLKSDRDTKKDFKKEVEENTKDIPEVKSLMSDLDYIMMMNFRNKHTGEELEYMMHGLTEQEQMAQYKAMRMAEIEDLDIVRMLYILFDIPYEFPGESDQSLYDTVLNERIQFFEEDSWMAKEISFAEIILNFAGTLSVEFGEPIDHYFNELFLNLGIKPDSSLQELKDIKDQIFTNTFNGEFGFGLFALPEVSHEPLNRQLFGYHGYKELDEDWD